MWLFKKKKEEQSGAGIWYTWINTKCKVIGHYINRYLQDRTRGLSTSRLKTACLVFVLAAGGGSTWVLINGLHHPSPAMQIMPFRPPAVMPLQNRESLPYDPAIQAAIDRITAFRRQMDHLKNDPEGRNLYDSLRQARPGLFDSIEKIEQLYRPRLLPDR